MNLILVKLSQSGELDAAPFQLINTVSNFVDDAVRIGVGKYNMRLSDDILVESSTKVRACLIGKCAAAKIQARWIDVNVVLVESFDAQDNPTDLGGEAFVGVESGTSIF